LGKLVHFQADGSPVEIMLDRQRITIGRRPDNDVCLPYPAVSGEHAVVVTILDDSFLEGPGKHQRNARQRRARREILPARP
jgi:pSer/pThr/pTyr-binding forkhead associated (FHA) protein